MNAIILAGGLSRRMNGTPKAFLRLGGETFLERVLGVLRPLVDSVLIVTNEPERYAGFDARVVRDEREGRGPLAGISSGLKASTSEASFVTAVDTPLLSGALVGALVRRGDACDVVVPRWEGELEPLCAVYTRRCLPAMEEILDRQQASAAGPLGRIVAFFPLVRLCVLEETDVRTLDPEGRSFVNINTSADYDRLCASFPGSLRRVPQPRAAFPTPSPPSARPRGRNQRR